LSDSYKEAVSFNKTKKALFWILALKFASRHRAQNWEFKRQTLFYVLWLIGVKKWRTPRIGIYSKRR
jgi:hypothetical protein